MSALSKVKTHLGISIATILFSVLLEFGPQLFGQDPIFASPLGYVIGAINLVLAAWYWLKDLHSAKSTD